MSLLSLTNLCIPCIQYRCYGTNGGMYNGSCYVFLILDYVCCYCSMHTPTVYFHIRFRYAHKLPCMKVGVLIDILFMFDLLMILVLLFALVCLLLCSYVRNYVIE